MSAAALPGEVDLLVVGGGLAGYCAALEAAEAGADVLLVEKEAKIGGATILSGGSFAFAGTPLQRRHGVEDSEDRLFADLRRVGGYANDERLVRVYVDGQRDTHDWLARHGVAFERLFIASGQSVPRAHSRNAQEVLDIVAEKAHATGRVATRLRAAAQRLVRDGPHGRVTGAVVAHGGVEATVAARRGVVLATGGFSRNEDLLRLFAPQQAGAQRMGGPGNTGDGLLMAWRLGAGFRDMGYIKGTFGNHPSAGPEDHFLLFPIYAGGIAVNKDAKRFVDESLSYKLIGDACLRQPGCVGFQVFDQPIFERGRPGIPSMDFQADLDAGRVVKAASLAELAGKLGLDAAALEAAVARYNGFVRAGNDEDFARRTLCNAYGTPVTIETPPFYGFASRSVVLATYCGLTVDEGLRVRDVFGAPIEGLHAAGGVIGGFHGEAYMTGTANGKAAIFGRAAARTALAH
jgi:fumarate reductase flavoprotein subunit